MPAGVGQGQRRLDGEHPQGFLVFVGELPSVLLLGQIEVADTGPAVTYRCPQKGPHLHEVAGNAQRPGVCRKIPQPQRFQIRAEELEKPQPLLGQVQQHLVFFLRQAGGYEVL